MRARDVVERERGNVVRFPFAHERVVFEQVLLFGIVTVRLGSENALGFGADSMRKNVSHQMAVFLRFFRLLLLLGQGGSSTTRINLLRDVFKFHLYTQGRAGFSRNFRAANQSRSYIVLVVSDQPKHACSIGRVSSSRDFSTRES